MSTVRKLNLKKFVKALDLSSDVPEGHFHVDEVVSVQKGKWLAAIPKAADMVREAARSEKRVIHISVGISLSSPPQVFDEKHLRALTTHTPPFFILGGDEWAQKNAEFFRSKAVLVHCALLPGFSAYLMDAIDEYGDRQVHLMLLSPTPAAPARRPRTTRSAPCVVPERITLILPGKSPHFSRSRPS